jgi:hypothetical protein
MTKNGLKIIRRKKPQTTADSFIRDSRLSLKAKGLMSLVLSLPKDWDFSIPGLLSIMNEGKASVYGALGELRKYGYCEYETKRDEKGKMAGTEYVFYEVCPLNNEDEPHPDYPYPENPHTEKRDTENPHPENRYAKDIEDIKGEDIILPPYNPPKGEEEKKEREGVFKKPTIEEIAEYCREKGYNIDAETFWNFYEAKGWMIGKNKMKNWRAACATWVKKRSETMLPQLKLDNSKNKYEENLW